MNKRQAVAIVLLMIFLLGSILPSMNVYAETNGNGSIDSALYEAIKENLKKQKIQATYNDVQHTIDISDSEIAKVTTLNLSNSNLTNLNGLEKFSSVISLDLSSNKLTDETDLSILNHFNLSFLDLSSNQISDVSEISNIKNIATVNLHNQKLDKVEVIDNSIVKQGTYKVQCELPQIVREFAKPLKPAWIKCEATDRNVKLNRDGLNSNSDAIDLTIGDKDGNKYTGLATLTIKIDDDSNKLYNSEINVYYVVINENQRAIFLKDKKLYDAVKAQLVEGQKVNSDLEEYTESANLFDEAYDKQQILVINENDLINKITSLKLDNKQLSDLSGLEMFVGLEKSLDLSSNYIKNIDTIVALQKMKDEEEVKLQARFKEKAEQLKERIATLETLNAELDSVIKAYNEASVKYNEYNKDANQEEGKTEKLAETKKTLEAQGKRIKELTGIPQWESVGTSVGTINGINIITGGEIKKAQENVTEKKEELYNIYNQIYKLTSVITPELKNITDEEYDNLTLEPAKALLEAQVEKMKSIEKYFTKEEKDYLKNSLYGFGIIFNDDEKSTPVATYYTEKLKILAEKKDVEKYKDELNNLREFDAFVMDLGIKETKYEGENYQLYIKNLDEEDNVYIRNGQQRYNRGDENSEDLLKLFSRIANASDEEIKAYVTLPRLYKLNMSENLIENIDEISVMKELRELNMANNEISNINNVDWKTISWLNTLNLSFNNISEIKVLEGMKKLKSINLSKNLISGSFNFDLNSINFDKLQEFDLSQNQISDIEDLKTQFEFKVPEGEDINKYVKQVIENKKINLSTQQLSMDIKIKKTSDRVKVELPKIFRQFEEIDGENTSFGIASVYGNAASDGSYVILETPAIGTRTAVVSVDGGIGSSTTCFIKYTVTDNTGNPVNPGENDNKDKVQINVNAGAENSVKSLKEVNNMSYIIVAKNTKVSDILKDVTLNTNDYNLVIKDANAQNTMNSAETVRTNQTVIVDGFSDAVQCRIVVTGDVTGDGEIGLGDVLRLNEYRLDNNKELTDAEFIAGNIIDTDNEINLADILGLNEYRLENM